MKSVRTLAALLVAAAAFAALGASSSDAQAELGRVKNQHGVGCTLPCCAPQVCYGNQPRACCGTQFVTMMLDVCHPCTGCPIQVPVCVPCDCVGVPTSCFQGTLFGAGRTVFTWCCGYKVVVRYQKCGDVMVYYR